MQSVDKTILPVEVLFLWRTNTTPISYDTAENPKDKRNKKSQNSLLSFFITEQAKID